MRFAVGRFRLTLLSGGRFWLDGGGMFGIIPKTFWSRWVEPDAVNRILLDVHCLLIQTPEANILVDTGLGSRWEKKMQEIYKLTPGHLRDELGRGGLKPEDIHSVVLTHLHFDHVGGALENLYDQWVPAFPKATVLVQRGEFEAAIKPSIRQRASYRPADFMPLVQSGKIKFLEGDGEPVPGVRLVLRGGHSAGFQMVRIEDGGQTAYYPGDLIPSTHHFRLQIAAAFDLDPEAVIRAKEALLKQAEAEEAVLILGHEPGHATGRLKKDHDGNYFLEKLKEI